MGPIHLLHSYVVKPGPGGDGEEALSGLRWSNDDQILDDKWFQESKKKDTKGDSAHLEGINWKVIVVKSHMINAFCLSGGNIVYYYGLLAYFKSDAEVATIMAPEFGHAVARHTIEGITKGLGFVIIQLVLYHFSMPDFVNKMSPYFMPLPHSRKMEIEADYIGLLLLASVGYDPQMAPKVFEKLVKLEPSKHMILNDYLTTHPSGEKRARLLSQANVMEEALRIYREVQYWSLH